MNTFVFLHDGYADWELAFLLPELIGAQRSVRTFALSDRPVRSMGGLLVTPDISIEQVDLESAEGVIIPGGTFWKTFKNQALATLVTEARARNLILGAICDATGYLAQLGLLDEVKHSSASREFLRERAPNYKGSDLYQDTPATRDGKLVSADGYGAVDFAAKLFELYEIDSPETIEKWYHANKTGKWRED